MMQRLWFAFPRRHYSTAPREKSPQEVANDLTLSRLRRALFNVPGSDERKIKKSTELSLDSVVLDLEDGVAQNQKDVARKKVLESFRRQNFGRAERLVRINAIGSGLEKQDLEECIMPLAEEGLLDGIVIPKTEHSSHLEMVHQALLKCGEGAEKVKFLAAIESARGLLSLREICEWKSNTPRLDALIFASEDFSANMGITRTPHATELLYARSRLVTFAVAYGLQSIDMVCLDYKNNEVLMKETTQGRQMGFTGKQAIHPAQLSPIYAAFCPSDDEIKFAQRILEENEKFQEKGVGAFTIDGKMIDLPMVKWAAGIIVRSVNK